MTAAHIVLPLRTEAEKRRCYLQFSEKYQNSVTNAILLRDIQ